MLVSNLGVQATVSDCTFLGNAVSNQGDNPWAVADVALLGGSPHTYEVTLNNTLLGDTSGWGSLRHFGAIAQSVAGGFNLIADGVSNPQWKLTNTVSGTANLGPLANNGGPTLGASIGNGNTSPTLTMALAPAQPRLAAGSLALVPTGVTTDQRGFVRTFTISWTSAPIKLQPALTSIAVTPNNSSNPKLAAGLAAPFTAKGTFADGSTSNLTNL